MTRFAHLLAATFVLASFSAHAQDAPVTPKEIQDTWVGKTVIGVTATGASVELKLHSDGAATVLAGRTADSGRWRVSENGYCATWKTIRAGQERCFTVRRSGAKMTVLNPDGSVNSTLTEIK